MRSLPKPRHCILASMSNVNLPEIFEMKWQDMFVAGLGVSAVALWAAAVPSAQALKLAESLSGPDRSWRPL
jgi:hypothetical protein